MFPAGALAIVFAAYDCTVSQRLDPADKIGIGIAKRVFSKLRNIGDILQYGRSGRDDTIDRLSPLITERYDGAIIAGASNADIRQLEDSSFSAPVALMNMDSQKYSSVSISHEQMGLQAASLLHKKGYQECAIVKSAERHCGTAKRTKAFLYACEQLGISVSPQWSLIGPATIMGGAQATLEYCALTKRPKLFIMKKTAWPREDCIPFLAAASPFRKM